MKNIFRIAAIPLISFSLAACSSSSKNIGSGYVVKGNSSFKLQPYKELTLDNGLKIFFVKDDTLPRLSLTLLVKAGTLQEPANQAGLNALTAYMLEQGTQVRSAMQIADDVGQLGSSLDISPGADFTTISSDALSTSAEALLALFNDVAVNPAFKDAEIARVKSQVQSALQKKIDNPSSFANEKISQYLFGEHPYGRDENGSPDTVRRISKQDIIKHYLTFYRPNNSSLAVVGKFTSEFETQVQEAFGKWAKRTIPTVDVPAVVETDSLKVKLVVKPGLAQTQIRISEIGIPRNDPDFLPLRLGNETLGGGFAGRLNQKIRDDLGLTYSIYSFFDTRKQPGNFMISTFTKNETAGKTLEETLKVVSDYVESGPTAKEVQGAKNQLVGQFPRAIETADRLALNLMVLDFYGIPAEYLTNYNKSVAAIKEAQAGEAMKRKVNVNKMKVLVYGDPKIIPQFQKYKPEIERLK